MLVIGVLSGILVLSSVSVDVYIDFIEVDLLEFRVFDIW